MSETETKSALEAAFEAAAEAVERVSGDTPVDAVDANPAEDAVEAEAVPDAAEAERTEEAPASAVEPVAEADPLHQALAQIAELESQFKGAEAQAAEWKTKAYRATADMDNARRRFQREREESRKFAVDSLMKDLLPVVDNLERAVGAAVNTDDPVVKGVEMVLRQFGTLMKNRGAEAFDPLGDLFDPQLHEAMSQMVSTEYPPGHISQVFQRGWMLYDRLVRPAMVIVAMAPQVEPEAQEAELEEAEVEATDMVDEAAADADSDAGSNEES